MKLPLLAILVVSSTSFARSADNSSADDIFGDETKNAALNTGGAFDSAVDLKNVFGFKTTHLPLPKYQPCGPTGCKSPVDVEYLHYAKVSASAIRLTFKGVVADAYKTEVVPFVVKVYRSDIKTPKAAGQLAKQRHAIATSKRIPAGILVTTTEPGAPCDHIGYFVFPKNDQGGAIAWDTSDCLTWDLSGLVLEK